MIRQLLKPRSILLTALFGVGLLLFFPVSLLRAIPTVRDPLPDTAIIMGYGFERGPNGEMTAGAANRFLLEFVLNSYPDVSTIFAQEGVWVAACPQSDLTCEIKRDGLDRPVTLLRIDRHDDTVDLHTMDITVCALERMMAFEKSAAILVAHDMQLWRAAENYSRAGPEICPHCEIQIAPVPDTPYPSGSDQIRTRYEFLYIGTDLVARTLDRLNPANIPQTCPMPMSEAN